MRLSDSQMSLIPPEATSPEAFVGVGFPERAKAYPRLRYMGSKHKLLPFGSGRRWPTFISILPSTSPTPSAGLIQKSSSPRIATSTSGSPITFAAKISSRRISPSATCAAITSITPTPACSTPSRNPKRSLNAPVNHGVRPQQHCRCGADQARRVRGVVEGNARHTQAAADESLSPGFPHLRHLPRQRCLEHPFFTAARARTTEPEWNCSTSLSGQARRGYVKLALAAARARRP